MQQLKKRVALLLSALMVLTLFVPGLPLGSVTAAAESTIKTETFADHTVHVWTPDGYETSGRYYPTLYLMPYDGYSAEQYLNDDIGTVLSKLMASDSVMDMIVVMPEFTENDVLHTVISNIVTEVDKSYRTIASSDFRAVLGADKGGYLAFEVAFYSTTGGSMRTTPGLFKLVGSHNGDFTSSGNPWRTKQNHNMASLTNSRLSSYYTYIDACSTNPTTYASDGSNAVVANLAKASSLFSSNPLRDNYDVFEYTIRMPQNYGSYTDAMARSLNRFSNIMGRKVVTPSYKLGAHSITSSMTDINLTMSATVNQTTLAYFTQGTLSNYEHKETGSVDMPLTFSWKMLDPQTGAAAYTGSQSYEKIDEASYTAETKLPTDKMASSVDTAFEAAVSFAGWTYTFGTDSLVRVSDPIVEGSNQQFDLMGDWYFNPYKGNTSTSNTLDTYEGLMAAKWKEWEVVQPGLGWWSADFSTKFNGNANWTGYAWYVREFDVPEGFSSSNLILALGMFDEADEAYINGVRVGATGIPNAGGTYDRSNPWDKDRVYTIPEDVINPGQTNIIAVRMCNSSGGGGWYTGPIAIYSSAAHNQLAGLPYGDVDETITNAVAEVVKTQNTALTNNDSAAYLATVSADYFQAGYTRSTLWGPTLPIEKTIVDENVVVYSGATDSGTKLYMYQADRSVGGAASTTVYLYFAEENGEYKLYGDHARWYTTSVKGTNGVPSTAASEKYHVYLPEEYFTSGDTRYPVTYMVHGINSTGLTFQIAGVPEILDAAIEAGEVPATIVVFPDLTSSPSSSSINSTVVNKILPEIDNTLRTIPDRRYRGMAGESYGGSTVAVVFTAAGAQKFSWEFDIYGMSASSYPTGASLEFLQQFKTYMIAGNHDSYTFDVAHISPNRSFYQKGYDHFFEIENGEHSSSLYNNYVVDAFAYIMSDIKNVEQPNESFITGTVDVTEEEDSLTVNWAATLDDYTAYVPTYVAATSATTRTAGTLVIPVTVSAYQNGKVVYQTTSLVDAKEAISGTVTIPNAYLGEGDCDVLVTASVLATNIPLNTLPVDKEALIEAIALAEEVDAELYTEDSYAALTEALEAAQEVLDNEEATQEEVDAATETLLAAIDALEEAPKEVVDPQTVRLVIYRNGNTAAPHKAVTLPPVGKGETLELSKLDIREYYTVTTDFTVEGYYNDGGWNSYKNGNHDKKLGDSIVINGWTNIMCMILDADPTPEETPAPELKTETVNLVIYRNGDTSKAYKSVPLPKMAKGEALYLDTLNIDEHYTAPNGFTFEGWYNDNGWNQYKAGNKGNTLGEAIVINGWTNIICMVTDEPEVVVEYVTVAIKSVINGEKDTAEAVYTGKVPKGANLIETLDALVEDGIIEIPDIEGYTPDTWWNWDWFGHKYGDTTTFNGWTNVYINYLPN